MNEKTQIKQLKKNNKLAQQHVYQQYSEQLFRSAYRYLQQVEDSEDVLIESFNKIFSQISTFEYRGDGSLLKWMKTIVINESLMFLRKKKEILVSEMKLQTEELNLAEENFFHEDIYKVIDKMPTGYRTVFNLFVIEGYSHHEIAEKLQISRNTSKSQLNKARKFLQQHLIKYSLC